MATVGWLRARSIGLQHLQDQAMLRWTSRCPRTLAVCHRPRPSRIPFRRTVSSTASSPASAAAAQRAPPARQEEYAPSCTATVPVYNSHLILHTGRTVDSWPASFDSVSPLHLELCQIADTAGSALEGVGIGVSDTGSWNGRGGQWDPTRGKKETARRGPEDEEYEAVLHTRLASHRVPFPVSFTTIPALVEWIGSVRRSPILASLPQALLTLPREAEALKASTPNTTIYVCTHGTRDCRCHDRGEPLFEALTRLVEARGLSGIQVARIGHIGGHKYAGNVLVYPTGEWYGLVTEDDAERLLDVISNRETWWQHWRGRIGIEKVGDLSSAEPSHCLMPLYSQDVQQALYDRAIASLSRSARQLPVRTLGRPTTVAFQTHAGSLLHFDARVGEDLKTVAKRNGAPGVEATCGGFCECATCMVYVGDAPIPDPSDEEEEYAVLLLDSGSSLMLLSRQHVVHHHRATRRLTTVLPDHHHRAACSVV